MPFEHPPHHSFEMTEEIEQKTSHVLSISDMRLQVFLAKVAYPNSPVPLDQWLMGDAQRAPLAEAYRSFVTDADASRTVDITNHNELKAVLAEIEEIAQKLLH